MGMGEALVGRLCALRRFFSFFFFLSFLFVIVVLFFFFFFSLPRRNEYWSINGLWWESERSDLFDYVFEIHTEGIRNRG